MKRAKSYLGAVVDGKLVLSNPTQFLKDMQKLKGDVVVIVDKRRTQRSLNANALYWMWLGVIEEETGQDKDEVHDFFKTKFLKGTKQVFGKVYEVVSSSAILDSKDFSDYMSKCKQFAINELNIILPEPFDQST